MINNNIEIGGIPLGIRSIKNCLPADKKGRTDVIRPLALVITYISYAIFSAARRPITVVQLKIIKDCNASIFTSDTFRSPSTTNNSWCENTVFKEDSQAFMQLLGSLFTGSYAVCMYFSGAIADYFNPRYFVSWGCMMGGFFMFVLGLANMWKINSIEFFSMGLTLVGAAQSTAWPVLLTSATHWYSGTRRGIFFSFWNTHYYIGSFFGILLAGSNITEKWGWTFFVPAVLLELMGVIIFFFLVVHPSDISFFDSTKKTVKEEEVSNLPPWMDSKRAIEYFDAFKVPGVLDYSGCMFFSRMVSFFFLFWRPAFLLEMGRKSLEDVALYSLPYIVGGFIGGLIIGVMKDVLLKSAILCISFLLLSIPAISLQMFQFKADITGLDIFFQIIVGLFVEAPYILLSTSISVDLGTHSLIRRSHRGLSIIASIIEGTGALGAVVGPLIIMKLADANKWTNSMAILMVFEILAALCLSRMAYREYHSTYRKMSFGDYWSKGAAYNLQ